MATIGMEGVGKIGLPISENLMKSGYRVLGYRRSSLADFEKLGGVAAKSPADIGAQCDVIRVVLRFGFMEQPDVPTGLKVGLSSGQIAAANLESVTYYTGHETVIPTGLRPGMAPWRESLFAFMHHNAQRPGAYFKIPSAQIMEIGIEFQI